MRRMDVSSHFKCRRNGRRGIGGWLRETSFLLSHTEEVPDVFKGFWRMMGGEVWGTKDF